MLTCSRRMVDPQGIGCPTSHGRAPSPSFTLHFITKKKASHHRHITHHGEAVASRTTAVSCIPRKKEGTQAQKKKDKTSTKLVEARTFESRRSGTRRRRRRSQQMPFSMCRHARAVTHSHTLTHAQARAQARAAGDAGERKHTRPHTPMHGTPQTPQLRGRTHTHTQVPTAATPAREARLTIHMEPWSSSPPCAVTLCCPLPPPHLMTCECRWKRVSSCRSLITLPQVTKTARHESVGGVKY